MGSMTTWNGMNIPLTMAKNIILDQILSLFLTMPYASIGVIDMVRNIEAADMYNELKKYRKASFSNIATRRFSR